MEYTQKNIIEVCTSQQYDLPKRVSLAQAVLQQKGYGDKEQELAFVTDVFKKLFNHYPILEHFEWSQYQDYNDNYNAYDIESFYVNHKYFINVFGFDWWEDEDWDYNFSFDEDADDNELKQKMTIKDIDAKGYWDEWAALHAQLQKDLAPIKLATDSILVFLKALYDYYKPYYFIYLFGRRAKVTITKQGISISNSETVYVNGNDPDQSFNPNSYIFCP